MRLIRVFHPEAMTVGETVALCESTHHYLNRVLRLRAGDAVRLVCGDGYDYHAILQQVAKQGSSAKITAVEQSQATPKLPLSLYLALLKGEAMDWALQKSVELGVTEIVPVITVRSERKLLGERLEKRLAHWQGVLVAAALQCGRAEWPRLLSPITFSELGAPAAVNVILSPHDAGQLLPESASSVALLIGPEGGFSEEEVQLAMQRGWQPQSLGARILRADTAAVVALAMAQMRFGGETW